MQSISMRVQEGIHTFRQICNPPIGTVTSTISQDLFFIVIFNRVIGDTCTEANETGSICLAFRSW